MLTGLTAILLVTALGYGWLAVVSAPESRALDRAVEATRSAHVAMVDQETALRAYLVTGEELFLSPYQSGVQRTAEANDRLEDSLDQEALADEILDFRIAQEQWSIQWAQRSVAADFRETLLADGADLPDRSKLLPYFLDGKRLFDEYRATQAALLDAARAERLHSQAQARSVLLVMMALILVICAVVGSMAGMRRRRLDREVVAPVHSLVATIADVSRGRLDPPPVMAASAEIGDLREGVTTMVSVLRTDRDRVQEREEREAATAARLRAVLQFAREVSGSLSSRYVLDAVTTGACSIAGAGRARVWMVEEGGSLLRLAFDSDVGRKGTVEDLDWPMGTGPVGRAAKYGQVSCSAEPEGDSVPTGTGQSTVGVPLIVGARVVGVLELEIPPGEQYDEEMLDIVETLAGHAAAALEAARLYADTEALSTSDALTGLANRRRLDADLVTEVELAVRHGRPLGFVMLDLDHFKKVNDTYGHQQGDQILQDVAAILRSEARPGDTVYRYGGEELAIVVRESDAEGARMFAERIRAAVEKRFTRAGAITQTLSAGVASVPEHASTPGTLVAAADAALYLAKSQGRNRVEVAGSETRVAGRARTDPTG